MHIQFIVSAMLFWLMNYSSFDLIKLIMEYSYFGFWFCKKGMAVHTVYTLNVFVIVSLIPICLYIHVLCVWNTEEATHAKEYAA